MKILYLGLLMLMGGHLHAELRSEYEAIVQRPFSLLREAYNKSLSLISSETKVLEDSAQSIESAALDFATGAAGQEMLKTIKATRARVVTYSLQKKKELDDEYLKAKALLQIQADEVINVINETTRRNEATVARRLAGYDISSSDLFGFKQRTDAIVGNANSTFSGIIQTVIQVLKKEEEQQAILVSSSAIKKLQHDKEIYQKRVLTLFGLLENYVQNFKNVSLDTSTRVTQLRQLGKPIDNSTISSVTAQMLSIVNSVINIYKEQGFSVNFQDIDNLAVQSMLGLINFYTNIINLESDAIRALVVNKDRDKTEYFSRTYELGRQLTGTKSTKTDAIDAVSDNGIEVTVHNTGKRYFEKQLADVDKNYHNKVDAIVRSLFTQVLQDLVTTASAPSDKDLMYGRQYYEVIKSTVSLLTPENAANVIKNGAVRLATLYSNKATSLLEQMIPGKDNTKLLDAVIEAQNGAAVYFKSAGEIQASSQASAIANALSKAKKDRDTARNLATQNDIKNAADSYQKAYQGFLNGGDAVDADEAQYYWKSFNGDYLVSQAQKKLTTFMSDKKSIYQQYLQFISRVPDNKTDLKTQYDAFLTQLSTLSSDVQAFYTSAVESYQSLDLSVLKRQGVDAAAFAQKMRIVQKASTGLSLLTRALSFMKSGLNELNKFCLECLAESEQKYAYAADIFRQLDTLYKENKNLNTYLPINPSQIAQTDQTIAQLVPNAEWTFETLLARSMSAYYISAAQEITDTLVRLQYYAYALFTMPQFHLPELSARLTGSINEMGKVGVTTADLVKKIHEFEKDLSTIAADAWQAEGDITYYWSSALTQWSEYVGLARTAYFLQLPEAKTMYTLALQTYAEAYAQHVPQQYFSSLGALLIYYRLSLVPDLANKNETDQEIRKLGDQFFSQGRSLVAQLKAVDLKSTPTENQEKVIEWIRYFDHAVNEQNAIVQSVSMAGTQAIPLFKKSTDATTRDITATFVPTSNVLSIVNPDTTLALIYKTIADTAFDAKDFKTATAYYYKALQLYLTFDKSALVAETDGKYRISLTRSTADSYRFAVIPNEKDSHNIGTASVDGINVPQKYQLAQYEQVFPTDLFDYLVTSNHVDPKSTSTEITLLFAKILYANNKAKELGSSFRENFVLSNNELQTVGSPKLEKVVAENIVRQTNRFIADLTDRITKKISSLYFLIRGKQDYRFGEVYATLPATSPLAVDAQVPIIQLPYAGYPIAISYFLTAQKLYQPGVQDLRIRGQLYVPGNMPENAKLMVDRIAGIYLTDSMQYKEIVDYLLSNKVTQVPSYIDESSVEQIRAGRENFTKVKNISNKFDAQLSITPEFQKAYTLLKNYYLNVILADYNFAKSYYELNQDSRAAKMNTITARMLEECAQALSQFLLGDPLKQEFGDMLRDISQMYKLAVSYYGMNIEQERRLYKILGSLFTQIGDYLVRKNNYFEALPFYVSAETLYSQITSDPQGNTLYEKVRLDKISTMFKGASIAIVEHQRNKHNSIEIKFSDGSSETVSFIDLTSKFQAWGTELPGTIATKPEEAAKYLSLKNNMLDGLIYYSTVQLLTSGGAQDDTKRAESDDVKKPAEELIRTYTERHKIDLSSLESITEFLNKSDCLQIILDGLDTCIKTIATNKDVGFRALSYLANRFFLSFGKIYMNDYLGGQASDQQWVNFTQAMRIEQQEILSPSSQYYGGSGGY